MCTRMYETEIGEATEMIPIIDSAFKMIGGWFNKKAADADAGNIAAKINAKEHKYGKQALVEAVRMFELIEKHKDELPDQFLRQVRYRKKKFYNLLARD